MILPGPALALLLVTAAQAPTAAVSGRVTDRGTSQPVPRMVVSLVGPEPGTSRDTTTAADGHYEFTGLAAGGYAVAVRHDEHRSTYLAQWFGESAPSAPFAPAPARLHIRLAAGERRTDLDVALMRALAIEGRVGDPWNDPLEGAEVIVSRAGAGPAGYARTDDQGAYRVFGLAPGRYRVCAHVQSGFQNPALPDLPRMGRTCYPETPAEDASAEVTLAGQDVTGIDIRVQRTGTRSISGTVVDAAGSPVDGAYVSALPYDDSAQTGSARTQGGAFVLRGLAPGRYMVHALIGGQRLGDIERPTREREVAQTAVDVGAIDAANVSLLLSKTVRLKGDVRFDGAPVPAGRALRMTVTTRPEGDVRMWLHEQPVVAAVNDDFTFELAGVSPAPMILGVQGLPDGWALKTIRYGGRDITSVATAFAASAAERVELVVTNRTARPSLRVTDERGEDAPLAFVVAIPADPSRWKLQFAALPRDPGMAEGTRLGPMLPGEYYVAALARDDYLALLRDGSRIESIASVGTRVTLEPGDARTLTLIVVSLPNR